MVSLFSWNESFLTHLSSVDDQHRKLVGLINDLGELVMSTADVDQRRFEAVRNGILDFVQAHFSDEEQLMELVGLDPRHIEKHRTQHQAFVNEAVALGEGEATPEGARTLTDYLVHWLAYHILDVDQSMARQIQAVRQGMSAAEAFEQESSRLSPGTEPLLAAMSGLFYTVSERNRELRALNRDLEARVRQRTQDLEHANQQLQMLSTQDDLTGLPNRRFAELSLRQLWRERQRYGEPLAVLMLDADHFKPVNDTFGHAQGDALIRELGARLRRSVRGSDVVCRIGGDEFLVICPRSPKEGATKVAEKILAESTPFHTPDGQVCWNGSVSLGVAEAEPDMATHEDLLQAADRALYAAKHAGGGRVA